MVSANRRRWRLHHRLPDRSLADGHIRLAPGDRQQPDHELHAHGPQPRQPALLPGRSGELPGDRPVLQGRERHHRSHGAQCTQQSGCYGARPNANQPLVANPHLQRRGDDHRIPDRGVPRRWEQLDHPRRQYGQQRNQVLAYRPEPGHHAALSGLRDQLGWHGSGIERRQRHYRRHRTRRTHASDRDSQRTVPDRSGLGGTVLRRRRRDHRLPDRVLKQQDHLEAAAAQPSGDHVLQRRPGTRHHATLSRLRGQRRRHGLAFQHRDRHYGRDGPGCAHRPVRHG